MRKTVIHIFLSFFLFCLAFINAQPCPQISTYFGKSQIDELKGICHDKDGNIYGIGRTNSNDLPITSGAFQSTLKGDYEAFLVKFDSCGALIWCTYFGTTGFDSGEKIAYSSDSTVVITGYTDGVDLDTTYNCFQPANNGLYDCFVAKFNLNGQPKWVSYFGGTNSDFSYAITVDSKKNIIIGGTSLSPTLYPTSASFQPNLAGAVDAFLVKFNKNGQLKFSTFYGGTSAEDIHNVTTDADGNIIGVGGSFSNNLNTSSLCLQSSSNGGMDVYIIKLDSLGNRLFSSYIGGSAADDCFGVCTDTQKNIYLTGQTASNDFYKTAVSHQTTVTGANDNYCLKLTPSGALVWSNIFGGTFVDNNVNCRIDANNNVYSLISSQSGNFPMLGVGNNTVYSGLNDMVVAKISANGQLLYSTYRGGNGDEICGDLILMKNKIVICGTSSSSDFPVITNNYQVVNAGQSDGFLTTIATLSINIDVGLKNYTSQICTAQLLNNFNNACKLYVPCEAVNKIIITDVLGRRVEEKVVLNYEVNLEFLNEQQVYFINGLSKQNELVFSQKLFLQNK